MHTGRYVEWATIILFLAALSWIGMVGYGGLRRVSLAQVGLMTGLLCFGLAAPRMHVNLFYVLMGMVIWSGLLATVSPRRISIVPSLHCRLTARPAYCDCPRRPPDAIEEPCGAGFLLVC